MRIAIFSDSYKPYLSGVTISASILVGNLRMLGHKVYIFAPSYPKHIDSDHDIIRFPSAPTFYPGFRVALPYIKHFPAVDIVHSQSPFLAGLLARYIAKKNNLPIVYTFHTLFTRYVHYAKFLPKRFSKLAITAYLREYCKRIDAIIAPSSLSKRVLRKWGIKTPASVIPTGIEFQKIRAEISQSKRMAIRDKLGIPQDAEVLVYLGRTANEKNINFIMQSFKKIYNKNRYLLVIGGGPLLASLKRRRDKNIIFTSELGHLEAISHCQAGDVFVFASRTETQGLVLAEAKAVGLPIVALFAGGLIDTVRSGIDGYLVENNIEVFSSHVDRLLKNSILRSKMAHGAIEDARERFSSLNVAKQVEAVYNSLIK